jgi:hypothetical protein
MRDGDAMSRRGEFSAKVAAGTRTIVGAPSRASATDPPHAALDARRSARRTRGLPGDATRKSREGVLFVALAALLASVSLLARRLGYAAGSDLGYALGLAGGIAMLLLFLYPLRKRVRWFAGWGPTRGWFLAHMVLGIVGPLLIILHSTLRFGSVNATVAFAAMSLVAGSGLVGRLLYRRIHEGLYGEKATLEALEARAGSGAAAVHHRLAFAPGVAERLDAFAREAVQRGRQGLHRPLRFFLLGFEGRAVRRACHEALERGAAAAGIDGERLRRRKALVDTYVEVVQRMAQFAVFDRLFSWWHVLHVPLVWLMVASAIAHVVAVHMY